MVLKKIGILILFIVLFSSLAVAADTSTTIINSLPELSITSMNLNPGTSRDIFTFITDDNGDTVTCFYCVEATCYTTCRIYAPSTPGIHRINITLNDTNDVVNRPLTIFVPGEVPSSGGSSGISGMEGSTVDKDPESPYSEEEGDKGIVNGSKLSTEVEESENEMTNSREETPDSNNNDMTGEQVCPTTAAEKAMTGKDILFTIIILILIAIIIWLLEKQHKKVREQRHKKIEELSEIFKEESEDENNNY